MSRILDEVQQRDGMEEDEMERMAQQQEAVEAYQKIEEEEILRDEIEALEAEMEYRETEEAN